MKKHFETYLTHAGEDISLSSGERARMRRMVHAYVELKPVRTPADARRPSILSYLWSPKPIAIATVAALFASSAGVSLAAENALPGDALYGVKVSINEPVSGALALSPSAKAAWATTVANERLKEAAALAAEGKLSTSTEAALEDNFNVHAALAAAAIEEQATSSPADGSDDALSFEAQLDEYARVLADVSEVHGVETASLQTSLSKARDRVAAIHAHAAAALASASTTTMIVAAARAQESAVQQIDASLALAENSSALSSSSASQVVDQLRSASSTVSIGTHFLATSSAPKALGAFEDALSSAAKLNVFLQATAAIHARTGLTVEEPEHTDTVHGKPTIAAATHANEAHGGRAPMQLLSAASSSSTTTGDATTTATDTSDGGQQPDDSSHAVENSATLQISVPTIEFHYHDNGND